MYIPSYPIRYETIKQVSSILPESRYIYKEMSRIPSFVHLTTIDNRFDNQISPAGYSSQCPIYFHLDYISSSSLLCIFEYASHKIYQIKKRGNWIPPTPFALNFFLYSRLEKDDKIQKTSLEK